MNKIKKMAQNKYSDMQQKNIDKIKKEKVIFNIKEIIQEFGEFNTADVDADYSPTLNTKGNLCHLIDSFKTDFVIVNVFESEYDTEIDEYNLLYEELELDVLEEILELAEQFKEQEIENNEN